MKPIVLLIPGLLAAVILLVAACGDGQEAPRPTATQPAAATATQPAAATATQRAPPTATETAAPTDGGVSPGQALFTDGGGCAACHTIEGVSKGLVGPDLTNIGADAASRKPGLSAREYIEESIRDPESFVAEGVERAMAGLMTKAITSGLVEDQVAALVDFLAGQK